MFSTPIGFLSSRKSSYAIELLAEAQELLAELLNGIQEVGGSSLLAPPLKLLILNMYSG
jgi:hypothetical protein